MSNNKELPAIPIVDDAKTNIDILLELLDDKYDVIPALNVERVLRVVLLAGIDLDSFRYYDA